MRTVAYLSGALAVASMGCTEGAKDLLPQPTLPDAGARDLGVFDAEVADAGPQLGCRIPDFPDVCDAPSPSPLTETPADDFQPPWGFVLNGDSIYTLSQGLHRQRAGRWTELEGLDLTYGNRVGFYVSEQRGALVQSAGTIYRYQPASENWRAYDLNSDEPDSLFNTHSRLYVGADARYAEVSRTYELSWVDVPVLSQDTGGGDLHNLVVAVVETTFGRAAADQFGRVAYDTGDGWRLSEAEAALGTLHYAWGEWIFARAGDGTIQRSCDGGRSWTRLAQVRPPSRAVTHLKQMHIYGTQIIVTTETGIAISCDFGETFSEVPGSTEPTFGLTGLSGSVTTRHRGGRRNW